MQIGPYWLAVGETGFGGLGWRPSFEAGPTDKKTKLGRRWRVLSELWLIRQRSPTVGEYQGELKPSSDVPQGSGRCKWPDGSTYEGEWRSGKMHGKGAIRVGARQVCT